MSRCFSPNGCRGGFLHSLSSILLIQSTSQVCFSLFHCLPVFKNCLPFLSVNPNNHSPISPGGITFLDTSSTHPDHVSEDLAKAYYNGLPSKPRLVATTRARPFEEPSAGPEAYTIVRDLRILGNHPLAKVWEDDVAFKIHDVLNAKGVEWTSTEVIRLGVVAEASSLVVIWVGVEPSSLGFEDAIIVALECREVLPMYDIYDVQVEIRESRIIKQAGCRFLDPVFDSNPTVGVRDPFTATLGIPICAKSMPWVEGTGGFFLSAGGDSNTIYLVTARHVVLPLNKSASVAFEYNNYSQPRYDVLVLGGSAFKEKLDAIDDEIKSQEATVAQARKRINTMVKSEGIRAERERWIANFDLGNAENAIEELAALRNDISTGWIDPNNRVLGHLVFAPPICSLSTSPSGYTQDFAVIEIDAGRLDTDNFYGNVIYLGTKFMSHEFKEKMCPHPASTHSFEFPTNRLKELQGQVPEGELRSPPQVNRNNEPCLMVYKSGAKTGVTIGHASNVCAYIRSYYGGEYKTSKEWPILASDSHSDPFSAKGDSGSVIADAYGRVVGLLTGGAGANDSCDVTYATPIGFIMQVLHATKAFENAHLGPDIAL